MFCPYLLVPALVALLLLSSLPTTSATFALAITSGTASILTLTAAQTSAVAAVAILGKLGLLAKLALLRRRGKRSAEEEEVPSLEMLVPLEVEDCYKRVICSASSGEVHNQKVNAVLNLFNPVQFMRAPLSHKAMKFLEAARFVKDA